MEHHHWAIWLWIIVVAFNGCERDTEIRDLKQRVQLLEATRTYVHQ